MLVVHRHRSDRGTGFDEARKNTVVDFFFRIDQLARTLHAKQSPLVFVERNLDKVARIAERLEDVHD